MTQYPPMQPSPGMLRPHRATAVLVLGILGLVLCAICGIIAWVMGHADLKEMEAGRMDPSGRGMTQAGKICGMIAVILHGTILLIYLLFAVILVGAGVASRP